MRVNYFINKPITKEEKIIMNESSSNRECIVQNV